MDANVKDQVICALKEVIDPELGVNIVDLGLVYDVETTDTAESAVRVAMTVTSPGCPMGAHLVEMARRSIQSRVPGAGQVDVDLVWDPPWNPMMMSVIARQQLGWQE